MKKSIFILLLVSLAMGSYAQEGHQWERLLGQVMTAEDMADEGWQQNYELLCELEQNPININRTTREELEMLPFLSAQQVEAIMEYLYRYGSMKSLAELMMIREIGAQERQLLQCFVYAGDEPKVAARAKHELTASAQMPMYERKGDREGYLGDKYRHWLRYQMKIGDNMKLGLVASKDAGEPFFKDKNKYGYDYYSPYLELKKLGRVETLVLGNYRVSMGMGMVMNNSFALGKIAMLQSLGRTTNTLRVHSSRTMGYLQGIGTTLRLARSIRLTAFASYTPMDATLNKDGDAQTIVTTGYHRTQTEMDKKNNLHALKTGGQLRYDANGVHLGLNALYTHLDRRLTPNKTQTYNMYKPDGSNFMNASIDYGYTCHHLAINGETATDGNGHIATINTVSYAMNNGLRLMALQRYFSYQYESLDAQSYSDGGRVQNESGMYVGLQWQPSPRWQLAAYADYAYHPWPVYREKTATSQMDYLIQCAHNSGNWKLTARYRLKPDDKVHRTRLIAEYAIKNFSTRTQLDAGYMATGESELGAMLSESVAYTHRWLRLNVGAGYFHTDSYNSRVYLYESGPLYTYSMQQFYGKGVRCWLMLRANAGRNLMLTAKIGVTNYFDRDKISSSYQEIDRSSKTDIDVQLRWKI
jgi:hypothetical protein